MWVAIHVHVGGDSWLTMDVTVGGSKSSAFAAFASSAAFAAAASSAAFAAAASSAAAFAAFAAAASLIATTSHCKVRAL